MRRNDLPQKKKKSIYVHKPVNVFYLNCTVQADLRFSKTFQNLIQTVLLANAGKRLAEFLKEYV